MSIHGLLNILTKQNIASAISKMQSALCNECDYGSCVYYVSGWANASEILNCGEILPRSRVNKPKLELSSTGVQSRRREVWLGNGVKPIHPKRETHNCLNFFFNPSNTTLDAFCRNQLIQQGTSLSLAIFEIPLLKIAQWLEDEKMDALWACTQKNVASGAYTESVLKKLEPEQWPWEKIFSIADKDHFAPEVSGEFLIWIGNPGNTSSAGLPVSLARCVLISEGVQPNFNCITFKQYLRFKHTKELLKSEFRIKQFIDKQRNVNLYDSITSFEDAVSRLPIQLSLDIFTNKEIGANYIHGIPHVTRVMFWCHVLTEEQLARKIIDKDLDYNQLKCDALLAALQHDLCRKSEGEDSEHGQAAAQRFANEILCACSNDSRRSKDISEAIAYHCRPDENYARQDNLIYRILKDADALDRGRFGSPCDGTDYNGTYCENKDCDHNGCVYKSLRLNYDTINSQSKEWPLRKNLCMVAWNIAQATASAPCDYDNPAKFLVDWLKSGQRAISQLQ